MPGFVALSGDRVSTWFLQGLHILRLRLRPQDLPGDRRWTLLAGTWFVLLALPTVPVRIDPEAETLSTPEALVAGYSLALMIWSIAVMAHVLRHALEWPLHRALALSLLYTVTNLLVHYGVFPVE
jgi:hypothetical protein